MKVVTIVGARPQFIKAAPVSTALREIGQPEFMVHTGQHYDYGMSKIFFEELGIPEPNVNLGVGSGSHGYQTGSMLIKLEEIIIREKPDCVLVYGDTNSTLAGTLAAVKLQIPVAHVEAGLRSFNSKMPEEHNRVLTDHCSSILFCPTESAVRQLAREGLVKSVFFVGDTMYDAVLQFSEIAQKQSRILNALELAPKGYLLATVHRPYNTDIAENLQNILESFLEIGERIIFPVHPRTRARIAALGNIYVKAALLQFIDPVGYLDMLILEQNARKILTDSGGVQKEAYFFGVPCITLRPETEWVETLENGWNVIVSADKKAIVRAVQDEIILSNPKLAFGDGHAARKIVALLSSELTKVRIS